MDSQVNRLAWEGPEGRRGQDQSLGRREFRKIFGRNMRWAQAEQERLSRVLQARGRPPEVVSSTGHQVFCFFGFFGSTGV
jgi:hypothetical protein